GGKWRPAGAREGCSGTPDCDASSANTGHGAQDPSVIRFAQQDGGTPEEAGVGCDGTENSPA
ncbi:hypothetical protein, partial [Bacillus sp. SIMBA_005]|uniref:hypothetical protein n=1 Tax=Bacillus sp. SIMBA_005 TaxID=3085754 RepID=UPI003979EC1F